MSNRFLCHLILIGCLPSVLAGEPVAEAPTPREVTAEVKALAESLPPEARPKVMKRAQNGTLYAELPNGLELLILEKHSAPVMSVQGWVRTGGIHENKWMGAGLSHFCEHMMFKGTSKRPTGQLDQDIRGGGGDNNAYTNSERTVYHVTGAASGFDGAFDALADMLMDSTFPPDETVKEHAVVYKEIERSMDNPDDRLWESFEQLLYQVHPYRVPVLGYPERFKQVTREDVFGYYQQRYSPQMCAFVAVGDFDEKVVLKRMAETLGKWKRKSVEPVAIPEEPEQVAPRSVQLSHPLCEVPKIEIGFPTVSLRHPDLYALDVLASILGDGRPSRLYRTVKDQMQLVSDISAFNYTPEYMGYLAAMATVEPGKVDDARAAIIGVFEEARNKAPSEDELKRAKKKVYTRNIFSKMTADGMAGSIGSDWFVAGDLDFSDHYSERIQAVTAEDVQHVAQKYLVKDKLNVSILLPQAKGGENGPAAAAAKVDEKLQGAQKNELEAELAQIKQDPAVESATLIADKAAFEIKLKPSGVRLVVKEDHSLPVVNLSIASLGGTRWEPAELAGSGNLLAEMLDRGTTKHSKLQIAEEMESLGASLSTFSGRNSFGINASGLKQDIAKIFEIASTSMLHPSFPEDELAKLKEDTLQEIAAEDESLSTINQKILRPLVYGNHPYARQTLGTPETVQKATSADLKRLHSEWVQPENIAISLVGDTTALEAVELSKKTFNTLKTGQLKAPQVQPIAEIKEPKTGELEKANIAGAVLTLAFQGTALKNPDRETLDVIAGILSGLGGRLNTALREKQGLAYSVGVRNDSQLDGGSVVFFIQTDNQSIDKALAGMWDEIRKLRAEDVPQKEIDSVKNYLVGTEAIEMQSQSDLAQRLALAQLYGEGASNVFSRRLRLDKVDAAQIKAAANKYFDDKRYAKAVLKAKNGVAEGGK